LFIHWGILTSATESSGLLSDSLVRPTVFENNNKDGAMIELKKKKSFGSDKFFSFFSHSIIYSPLLIFVALEITPPPKCLPGLWYYPAS
jgi:hypothetical protein